MMMSRRALLIATGASAMCPGLALAQEFPTKPLRIIVPYPAGGPTDALARIVGRELQAGLGQAVVVENRPGGAGAIGTREGVKAEPDGHTLVLGNNQTHATNALLMKDLGYDPVADFVPVAGLADLQHALVVSPAIGINTVAELVARAKKDPGKLNYGSTGIGSGSHLTMELFKARTGTEMQHVPFTGAAPMATEIVAGRIDVAFSTLSAVLGQIQGGSMKALAIASNVRAPQLPSVPLLKEQGVVDSEGDSWLALFAPAKAPAAAVDKMSRVVQAALARPDVVEAATKLGIAVNVRGTDAFKAYHLAEMTKWGEVVRIANVKIGG
jgi:tripartite-type tricarboxylate transporter receptor subunit TctC